MLMLLLTGGVWIAIAPAIVGWVGQFFFTATPLGKNLFTAFLLVEIAEVTPPVGLNLFVIQKRAGKDSNVIAMKALPFFGCLVLCIATLIVFPVRVTWLPDVLMGVQR